MNVYKYLLLGYIMDYGDASGASEPYLSGLSLWDVVVANAEPAYMWAHVFPSRLTHSGPPGVIPAQLQ